MNRRDFLKMTAATGVVALAPVPLDIKERFDCAYHSAPRKYARVVFLSADMPERVLATDIGTVAFDGPSAILQPFDTLVTHTGLIRDFSLLGPHGIVARQPVKEDGYLLPVTAGNTLSMENFTITLKCDPVARSRFLAPLDAEELLGDMFWNVKEETIDVHPGSSWTYRR
jgi:hypothetical protein